TRLRTDNSRTYYFTLARCDDFYVTVRVAFSLRAVIVIIGPARHANLQAARTRLFFCKANMRELRLCVGHPRDGVVVHTHRKAKQRISDHQTGMIIRSMCEL